MMKFTGADVALINRMGELCGLNLAVEILQATQEGRDLAPLRDLISSLQRRSRGGKALNRGGAACDRWIGDYRELGARAQRLPPRRGYHEVKIAALAHEMVQVALANA